MSAPMSPQQWAGMSPLEQQQWQMWQAHLAHNEWVRRSAADQMVRRRAVTKTASAVGWSVVGVVFGLPLAVLLFCVVIAVLL